MDIQEDEMFKLLKVRMNEWKIASRVVTQSVVQTASASASNKAGKAKPGKAGAQEEEKKSSEVFVDNTPAGQRKDMSQPMASEYQPK